MHDDLKTAIKAALGASGWTDNSSFVITFDIDGTTYGDVYSK